MKDKPPDAFARNACTTDGFDIKSKKGECIKTDTI